MTSKQEMYDYVNKVAEKWDYYLCPDEELLEDLVEGLAENKERYGYPSCPCRPASGEKKYDNDIICPCEYCEADVEEHGMCYCGLYVSEEVNENPSKLGPIPERRPEEIIEIATEAAVGEEEVSEGGEIQTGDVGEGDEVKVWRCEVCGYLCAREMPPPVCPICKVKADRFEEFELD